MTTECCLEPCPHCGAPAETGTTFKGGIEHSHYVCCTNCPMSTPWRATAHEVQQIWNRRPDSTS